MIDLHCHILSNVDDGAQNMSESIEMAKEAVREGIHTIVATPHHKNGRDENAGGDISAAVRQLNEVLSEQRIPLTVLPGQEVRIYGELLDDLHDSVIPLNITSQYIFIELPSNHVPRYTEQLFYDIQMQGLVPVIVHPERNAEIIENPDKLYKLVKKGSCTQVTASSVVGRFGKKIQRFTHHLIEANLTHFVASDAHNVTTRSFHMRKAYDLIDKEFGTQIKFMLMDNAQLLIDGHNIYRDVPERIKRKKFLGIF
ncbi:tyrosine-protein phosphatase [Falsibacillus albus]|uniref:Tyrosine-protein phosphatase n=1 Tax=Falsibacillus albus TaxID=2478915 RepID=A0A3L7JWA4_9BACI|nr:CpsB/CapC family capsule biosynthesis tyrosine phosphatase [Falsibacillus albus]RLQ94800.1 tyrosine protein phosphatase [Falsibacillus albus]